MGSYMFVNVFTLIIIIFLLQKGMLKSLYFIINTILNC